MSNLTYDNIEPNIADVDVDGANVTVKWKCPVSGRVVCESSCGMKPLASTTGAATKQVKRALLVEAIGAFNRFVKSTFGGTAGKIVGAASASVRTGVDKTILKASFNTATEHAATVNAFRQVEKQFKWDEDRELFVSIKG